MDTIAGLALVAKLPVGVAAVGPDNVETISLADALIASPSLRTTRSSRNLVSPPCGQYSHGTARLVGWSAPRRPFPEPLVSGSGAMMRCRESLVNHFVVFFLWHYISGALPHCAKRCHSSTSTFSRSERSCRPCVL